MKKRILLFTLLIPLFLGCNNSSSTNPSISISSSEESIYLGEKTQTVNFYLDYSHSSTPIYTMKWYNATPLGKCPDDLNVTDEDASDPAFPHFIGWPSFSSAIDETKLWNFETDYKTGNKLELFGIWIAED